MESPSSPIKIKKNSTRWIKSELIQYIIILVLILASFYAFASTRFYSEYLQIPISTISAKICTYLLNLVGISASVQSVLISIGEESVSISKGCDGIAPIILVSLAILFFPTQSKRIKLYGILKIVTILFLLNLFRIITLVLSKLYAPTIFDFLHIEFWQITFIIVSSVLFIKWLSQVPIDAKN
ncbi:MAG: archaeosortase/exosortase family protein [Bacteroidota bacterium]|nr:archaeosortase/exosortase family protein [Bacteroidota bacterium]